MMKLQAIQSPTLIIVTEEDEWGDSTQALEISNTIPNCELVILPDADHNVHMTHPDIVNKYIEEYLKESLRAK